MYFIFLCLIGLFYIVGFILMWYDSIRYEELDDFLVREKERERGLYEIEIKFYKCFL